MTVEEVTGMIAGAARYRIAAAEAVVTGNAARPAAQNSGCLAVGGRIWSGSPAAMSVEVDSSSAGL